MAQHRPDSKSLTQRFVCFPRLVISCLVLILGVAAAVPFSAFAQAPQLNSVTNETQTPVPGAGHDYQHMLNETVNMSNGSVSFKIAFPQLKGRGISLPAAWSYNSASVNTLDAVGGSTPTWNAGGMHNWPKMDGWNLADGVPLATMQVWSFSAVAPGQTVAPCNVESGMTFSDMSGVTHNLRSGAQGPDGSIANIYTCGSTGTIIPPTGDGQVEAMLSSNTTNLFTSSPMSGAFVVTDKAGTVYSFPGGFTSSSPGTLIYPTSIEDRNGNAISPQAGTDTMGRALQFPNSSNTNTPFTIDGVQYTPSWSTDSPYYYSTFALSSGGYLCSPFPSTQTDMGTRNILNSLTLPNGQQYRFFYDTSGEISKIIFPDGGWIGYIWQEGPALNEQTTMGGFANTHPLTPVNNACTYTYVVPTLLTREVSFDGTNVAQTQNFSYTTAWVNDSGGNPYEWTQKTTTVQTTDNETGLTSKTVYTYGPLGVPSQPFGGAASIIPVESTIAYYDWGQTSLTKTVTKTWLDQFNMSSQTTTINATNQTSGTYYTYSPLPCTYPQQSGCSFQYLTEQDDYDFGTGTLGALKKRTLYNYRLPQPYPSPGPSNAPYANYSGLSLPPLMTSVTVEDGSSTPVIQAATQYTYDGATPSAVTSTAHDSYFVSSTPPRGNITTVTRCNPLPSTPTSTCSGSTSGYAYDTTGQPTSSTDANGNATVYSFADNFYPTQTSPNTNAYLTKVTRPAVNGVNHISQFAYRFIDGLVTKSTDENGGAILNDPAHTTMYSYDSLNRLILTQLPPDPLNGGLQGSTSISYNDATVPTSAPSVTTSELLNTGGAIKQTVQIFDGMWHVTQSRLVTGLGSGDIIVDTAYDGEGRVLTKSNPHIAGSSSSDGTTTYSYDAFGRQIQVTNQDGTTLQWCYDGVHSTPAVASGLCSSNQGYSSPGTLGTWVDSSDELGNHWQRTSDAFGRLTKVMEPNGLTQTPSMETDYAYDTLNDLGSVSQWGGAHGSTGARSRSFTYDSLGRLTSAFNPEKGTINYIYDPNGNLADEVSPAVNVTSGSTTQTMGYCYDALNRVTYKLSIAASGFACAPVGMGNVLAAYSYDKSTISGTANPIGRLTEETSYQAGAVVSDRSIYGYDVMGRPVREQQTPYGSTAYQFLYGYDLAGDVTCTNNGFATVTSTSTCSGYTPLTNSMTVAYQYDAAQRLSSASTANGFSYAPQYGPVGALSASYGTNYYTMSNFYDNRMHLMDHTVYPNSTTYGSGTVTITGTEAPGDSGTVSVTAGGVHMSVPYGTGSSTGSIAAALVSVINQTQNSFVSASCISGCPGTGTAKIMLTALEAGGTGNSSLSAISTDAGSSSSSFTATASGLTLTGGSGSVAHHYALQYAANGNIKSSTDNINGNANYFYDTLNRLVASARSNEPLINGTAYANQCWGYDPFGNRLYESENVSAACPSPYLTASTVSAYTPPTGSLYNWSSMDSGNHVAFSTINAAAAGFTYDLAGNVLFDGVNKYVYDMDGRICAVWNTTTGSKTQYVYDAEGRRVAKGNISSWPGTGTGATCAAPTGTGFTLTSVYLRGLHGDQDTELGSTGNWVHTNIFAGGDVTATYWTPSTGTEWSYTLSDWVGTKRAQVNAVGAENIWQSDPYGDYMTPIVAGKDATEHHFTNKERDVESGNDYFGARYYMSLAGRFMSPDWSATAQPVPYAKLQDPQSLNLYEYVGNNPVGNVDMDGHVPLGYGGFGFEDCTERGDCSQNVTLATQNQIQQQADKQAEAVFQKHDQDLLAEDLKTGLYLFPTIVPPKNYGITYRLRTANGKRPKGRYTVFEHQTQHVNGTRNVGPGDNISPRTAGEAKDVAANSFPDSLGGGRLDTVQTFTFSIKFDYDPSTQNSVSVKWGDGSVYGSQHIWQPSGKDPILINGSDRIPVATPETIGGEY